MIKSLTILFLSRKQVTPRGFKGLALLKGVFLLIVWVSLISYQPTRLIGQEVSGVNLSEINVDDLSDEQILSYVKQAQQQGYTQAQLEELARLRGVSESQIAKLRQRINQLNLSGSTGKVESENMIERRSLNPLSEDDVFGLLSQKSIDRGMSDGEPKVFGMDLFRSDKLTFAPNLNIPTPTDYVLGPGDELVIDLWGAIQEYFQLTVSAEGSIRPQDLSPVYVNGLTIAAAEEKIIDRLSQIYQGLKGTDEQKQSIFYQISLGNIRTINVSVVGEVEAPGNYALNSLSTVFTALYAAGGPTERGTFRNVRLIRDNKLKREIDLYDFLLEGMRPDDEILQNGDIVVVKLYNGQVELEGEVRRPGIYEIKQDESFAALIGNAGGFNSQAYRSFITVDRNAEGGKRVLNIDAKELEEFQPQDGDIVSIRMIQDQYENRVQVTGAIQLEGTYELLPEMTVSQLIAKAGGPKGDAHLKRATIYRVNTDFSSQTLAFDLQKLLSGEITDLALKNDDILRIWSVYDLNEEFYVEINGEVSLPGVFPYFTNMTVEDLILLAGGLNQGASGTKVEISRRVNSQQADTFSNIVTIDINKDFSVSGSDESFRIEPFDQVYIRKDPNYGIQQEVVIEGEVLHPGKYAISRKDERISDIVKRAEGMTQYAYPEGAILIRRTQFAEKKGDLALSKEKLAQLKDKVLRDTLGQLNQSKMVLVDRLKELARRIETEMNAEDLEESVGIRFKKEIAESIAEADTLTSNAEISEQEPTVLQLKEILEKPGSKYDYILKPGDIISVPSKLETIRVAGEVISPLNLRFEENRSFREYITDAGGFTANAKKGRSYVQYPNGRIRQARRFLFFKFYPKVEPGSIIFVSRKPEREPVNLQAIIAATGSIATLALVIDRLSN